MSALRRQDHMKMQELERRSGVPRDTIRHYIRLGLLPEPDRPKPNVAVYSDENLHRLATIRRLQRERYLPLSFIKTLLDRPSHGAAEPIPGFAELLAAEGFAAAGSVIGLAEAGAIAGVTEAEIEVLARDGSLFLSLREDGVRGLAPRDLDVAKAWGEVKAAGFGPRNGFFADDVGIYAEALNALAILEIERFFTRVPGGRSSAEAAHLARAGIERVADLIVAMRTNFLLRKAAELEVMAGRN